MNAWNVHNLLLIRATRRRSTSRRCSVIPSANVDLDSIPDVIQWFLDFDQRVAIIKHPNVEEVFQWKQEQSRAAGEKVFDFNRAEDRLAIGIIQALVGVSNGNRAAFLDQPTS